MRCERFLQKLDLDLELRRNLSLQLQGHSRVNDRKTGIRRRWSEVRERAREIARERGGREKERVEKKEAG